MACRGVHFALTTEQEQALLSTEDDEALLEIIQEQIENEWDRDHLCETDKAWDAIHRCLTDGGLSFAGTTQRHQVVLGGRQLHRGDDYIISYVAAEDVIHVAESLKDIDEEWMRNRYFAIDAADYGMPLTEEDFGYTWDIFADLRSFLERASEEKRAVVFTVDQ